MNQLIPITNLDISKKKSADDIFELLKEKYNITCSNFKIAKKTFELLEASEFSDYYEYGDEGNIIGFYSKIMLDRVLKKFEIINPTGAEEDNFIYKNGVYQKSEVLKNWIYSKLSVTDKHVTRNIKEELRILAISQKVEPDSINADGNLINFKNGIYVIDQDHIIDHDCKIPSTIQINANYAKFSNEEFEKSLFYKYITTSFDEELLPIVQEVIGYCLSNLTEAQKMFILVGEGKNGKSVFISILNAFFDKSFISNVELKDLCKHEFVARLYNKSMNTCADISNEYMENTGLLKQILGEDKFEARPLYSNPFSFKNRAKMVFSANDLPQTSDKSYAFLRRMLIIDCNKRISEENKIKFLSEKIISSEMDLIASWAIIGLQRLINNNFVFTDCQKTKSAIEDYKLRNSSISSFITDFCNIKTEDNIFIPKIEFMEMYKRYCLTENSKPLGTKNINKTMTENGIYEKHTSLYSGRYWKGISWNNLIKELTTKDNYRIIGSVVSEREYTEIEREGIKSN
jgi:putative DNA primase/helicase